jgi:hypothetical protein
MEILPDTQNLDRTFSTTIYFIDFYQRDYKWTEVQVKRLIDDLFYQFDEAYAKHYSLEPKKEYINGAYPWYYLNTYVTNNVNGNVFVVDGQQRLTTLTLMLLKLLSIARILHSKTDKWLERKIAGYSGTDHEFWMNHMPHLQVLEGLMEGDDISTIDISTGITAENMIRNFKLISNELDMRLKNLHIFDTFVYYFLLRLVLINLTVESDHVPMVFEVINDRGLRLKPYEILKGKLLGQIDKIELESGKYNSLWEQQLQHVNSNRNDEIDQFFRYWLKAKFSDSHDGGQRFDSDYHREIFKPDINITLRVDHNAPGVKSFLNNTFRYYTNLYCKLWDYAKNESEGCIPVFFNHLNEQNNQFMLVISACTVDDPEEEQKIQAVANGIDRIFSLLQLQGSYDSRAFTSRLFAISAEIRERPVAEIPDIFQKHLLDELRDQRGLPEVDSLNYIFFRPMSIDRLNTRFARYLFSRIELLLSNGMKQQMKQTLSDLVQLRGPVNGFHIEHIISRNDYNLALFNNDEERFEQERNRLGGLLLLKGRDNCSSGNETYSKKLETYANTLLWNETLRQDSYKSKLDFMQFVSSSRLAFRPLDHFGPEELEERHKLLFEICKLIWSPQAQAMS